MKFYTFDFDDNILSTSTQIHIEKLVNDNWIRTSVGSIEFAEIRKNPNYRLFEDSFSEFRDFGIRGNDAFFLDFQDAIKHKAFAPSYNIFKQCIINGDYFAIITSRGHNISTFKRTIQWFIEFVLTYDEQVQFYDNVRTRFNNERFTSCVSKYLDKCCFYGVSNPNFYDTYKEYFGTLEYSTENGKVAAMKHYIEYAKSLCVGNIKVGFSDDDLGFVNIITNYMKSLDSSVQGYIFNTNGGKYGKTKIDKELLEVG